MGSWLSSDDKGSTKSETKSAADIEYEKLNKELKEAEEKLQKEEQARSKTYRETLIEMSKEEDNLVTAAKEAEETKKKIAEESKKRQEEVATQRMTELENSIVRAKELKEARKLLNIQASQLLCAIYYNYQFGREIDAQWTKNVNTTLDDCLCVESFWLLCKIPQLLPLLWPTGEACDSFHTYTKNTKGEVSVSDYKILINSHITQYVGTTLKTYLINLFKSNCKKTPDYEDDNELKAVCKKFLEDTENVMNDTEWFKKAIDFIKDDDKMNWKCFAARSKKGICNNTIELLPSTFPKVCPKCELYEALLMLTNTVLNHYGDLKVNNLRVKAGESTSGSNKGGMCFSLNESWVNNTFSKGLNTSEIWDGESYVEFYTAVLSTKDVTGEEKDEDWMTKTSLYDKTEVYAQATDGTGGYQKYVNPTQKYTRQFVNDENNVEVAFQMPRLGAAVNEKFTKNFLKNIFAILQTEDYQFNNIFVNKNKNIFTSIDYIYLTPKGFEQLDNVSPISRFIFEILVKDSCKWYLSFPVENSMSFMKINSVIMSTSSNDKKLLPQYVWAKSPNQKDTVPSKSAYTYTESKKYTLYFPKVVTYGQVETTT